MRRVSFQIILSFLIAGCSTMPATSRIEYSNPDRYLSGGKLSTISNSELKDIIRLKLRKNPPSLEAVANAFRWKRKHFSFESGGGALIGKRNVDQLYAARKTSGCHDDGLIFSAVLREMGIPTVLVEATGIQWSKDLIQGSKGPYEGHVFAEIYLDSKWILVDPTSGEYIENHDPADPVIPITHDGQHLGYYAIAKGVDPLDYGIRDLGELQALQRSFAGQAADSEPKSGDYLIQRL